MKIFNTIIILISLCATLYSCGSTSTANVVESVDSVAVVVREKAVIDDPDGFVNVREEPVKGSRVVGKIAEGEVFYYGVTDNDWWEVAKTPDGEKIGYVHQSRIRPIADAVAAEEDKTTTESTQVDDADRYNYLCSYCGTVIISQKTPAWGQCSVSGSHHNWSKVSKVGDLAYSCSRCGAVVYADKDPNPLFCPAEGSHHWVRMN